VSGRPAREPCDEERSTPAPHRTARIAALAAAVAASLTLVAACGDAPEKTGTGPSVTADAGLLAVTGGTTTLTLDLDTLGTLGAAGVAARSAPSTRPASSRGTAPTASRPGASW
jgi:hypothetical protein